MDCQWKKVRLEEGKGGDGAGRHTILSVLLAKADDLAVCQTCSRVDAESAEHLVNGLRKGAIHLCEQAGHQAQDRLVGAVAVGRGEGRGGR